MMKKSYSVKTFIIEIFAVLIALLFLSPFYFIIVNSLKTFKDLVLNTASLPKSLYLENYTKAFEVLNYPKVFSNSLIITLVSNLGLVVISSMAAYRLVRNPTKINKAIFGLFIASMVIPFQSIMIPMVKITSILHMQNNYFGIVFCYFGFGVSLSVFMFHGFIKSIPLEIEESAILDGCSSFALFWKIVFPLLKPITVTLIILNSLWIWNDFLLPLLIIPTENMRTIPLAVNAFFSQYTKQWDLAMAALVMGVIPVVIVFISLQKHIIEGITVGSVKG